MIRRQPRLWLCLLLLFAFVGAGTVRAAHVHEPLLDGKSDSAHCDFCLGLDRAPAPPSATIVVPLCVVETTAAIPQANADVPARRFASAHSPRGPPR